MKGKIYKITNLINLKIRAIVCLDANKKFDSITDAAKKIGVKPTSVWSVVKGLRKTIKGLAFQYADNLR